MLPEFKIALKHTSIYGITNIMKKGAAFFMIPVYTHFLSPADYGTLELLDLVLDVTGLLLGLQMSGAVIRYYHHYDTAQDKTEVISTAFLFVFFMAVPAVVTCQLLSGSIAELVFNDPSHSAYLGWIFICLGCNLLYLVPEAYLIVEKRSMAYSTLSFLSFILSLSLNIFFLVGLKLGVWGMVYSMTITKISYMILLFIVVLPRFSFSFSFAKLGQMLRFGFPTIPGVLSLFVINFSDRFFIQQYCSTHDLGIYSLGYKFGMLLVVLMTDPFLRIWNTQRYEIAPQKAGPGVIGQFFTYYLAGLLTLALVLCVFSDHIILLMADSRYAGSNIIIPLITVSYIFQGLAGFATLGIMVSYKTKFILYANLSTAVLNIGLNYFLIRYMGIHGAALATIISYAVLFVVLISISQKLYRIEFETARLIRLMGVAVLVFGLANHISVVTMGSFGLKALLLFLFPLSLYAIGFFSDSEIGKIKKMFS